ncbi:MAG: fasciclin domain-containing protein [Prevotella sp.]|nr:fasciclin domain-containing protein [Prevotella sp.]
MTIKRFLNVTILAATLSSGSGLLSSCDKYDLDERTPDGWGASIYSWLDEAGNFTNTVRIIDDLGYREVLAKTGSKTLFVADDAAYERFFQNNTWGVKKYSDLTISQKKLLLFGSMMNNSLQLNSLPSVEGNPPREGESMRRFASSSPYDSVTILRPEHMPDNPYWKRFKESGLPMVCMMDNTEKTLVQFIEKLLVNKRITNSDYDFLFNNTTKREAGDASINGVQVENPNIKCSNGFIHQMEEVIMPLPNMAEVIRLKSNVSEYNHLLERYCAPYPDLQPDRDGSMTMQYNFLYPDRKVDTVYQKRFFSKKSQGGSELNKSPDNGAVTLLKFDPEWNAYYAGDAQTGNTAIQRDMAVMMVPSNAALDEYWNNGVGRILQDQYKSWDKVPDDVVAELINNNMLSSFVISVPSKFNSILNDANDPMGVDVADIDSVWLGCNGAVYLTNKVYSPTSFVSVLYPALTNESMKILYWAAQKCRYNVYLNSLNARYSLFIPDNNALLQYIDPCSYGKGKTQLFQFHWDPTKVAQQDNHADERVWASIWNYDLETGEIGDSIGKANFDMIKDRLQDILDNHIVIGDVEDGRELYQTKGGTILRIGRSDNGNMTVAGSYQIDNGTPLEITEIYDQTVDGNGKAYVLKSEPIMTTRKSVFDVLGEYEEFALFRELLEGSGLLERIHDGMYSTPSDNLSPFNTYHYTVYVPTNESIQKLIDTGKLPTWESVEIGKEMGNDEKAAADSLAIVNFLKYHIQDNSLVIGSGSDDDEHETALIDSQTQRFYQLHTWLNGDELTIRDNATYEWAIANGKIGSEEYNSRLAKVLTSTGLYNLMAREYQYNSTSANNASQIQTTSAAIIHLIDKPLIYKE